MTTIDLRTGIVLALAAVGVLFMLISAVGIIRLPDVFTRMHAAGQASTLGIGCVLLGVGLFHGSDLLLRMLALIALFFVTSPISTTTMARAAYRVRQGQDDGITR